MCLNPTLIKNVNHFSRNVGLNALNINTQYIAVPCGTCASCVALKQSYIIQRCQLESIDNDLWMCSLSYNREGLPVKYVNGRRISYALKSDFQNWIKMIRKYDVFGSSFRYLCVSERGSERHRPHWHVIFSTPKIPNESFVEKLDRENKYRWSLLHYWRRNYGSTRKPLWKPLLTYVARGKRRNYDFHYVNPSLSTNGEDDVAFYVTKYVLKIDEYEKKLKSALYFNLPEDEFKKIWSEVKSHFYLSKGFGDVTNQKSINYVRSCIDSSLKDETHLFPVFINPVTGQEFPLSPYLRNKFLSVDDAYTFYERRGANDFTDYEDLTNSEYETKHDNLSRRRKLVYMRNSDIDFEDDFVNTKYISPSISIHFLRPWDDFKENTF